MSSKELSSAYEGSSGKFQDRVRKVFDKTVEVMKAAGVKIKEKYQNFSAKTKDLAAEMKPLTGKERLQLLGEKMADKWDQFTDELPGKLLHASEKTLDICEKVAGACEKGASKIMEKTSDIYEKAVNSDAYKSFKDKASYAMVSAKTAAKSAVTGVSNRIKSLRSKMTSSGDKTSSRETIDFDNEIESDREYGEF